MEKMIRIPVSEELYGQTGGLVRTILRKQGFSRREISRLKFRGKICCGERSLHVSDRLSPGDVLTLVFAEQPAEQAESRIVPVILYEDEDMIVADKPSGIPVHASHGHLDDSLGTALSAMYRARGEELVVRTIGRLDSPVSGLTVYAKNRPAAARLFRKRENGTLRKVYIALAEGSFPEKTFTVCLPLARREGSRKRGVSEDGREAETRCRVVSEYDNGGIVFSVLLIEIRTGRTHQIRAHLSACGHPLLGDELYGGSCALIGRPALHCAYLKTNSPFSDKIVEVRAPLGRDLREVLPADLNEDELFAVIRNDLRKGDTEYE